MGLTRQTVRTTVRELEASGFVELAPNPHHQRAHLVVPTPAGAHAYVAAADRQAAWAKGITRDLDGTTLTDAAEVLRTVLAQLLDASADDET